MNALHRLADEASFHGHDYHGLDVQPQAAEAATEVGVDDAPRWIDSVTPRTGALLVALSAASVIAAIAAYFNLYR